MGILLYGGERKRSEMLDVYFADRGSREKKKIMEKEEDYVRKVGKRQG